MENKINEAYIANFRKYMHLLSINETLAEIKKFKALINTFRLGGYHERKKKYFKKCYRYNKKTLRTIFFKKR